VENPKNKKQNPNFKEIPNYKIQISKNVRFHDCGDWSTKAISPLSWKTQIPKKSNIETSNLKRFLSFVFEL
jgi:hypothetical protein